MKLFHSFVLWFCLFFRVFFINDFNYFVLFIFELHVPPDQEAYVAHKWSNVIDLERV